MLEADLPTDLDTLHDMLRQQQAAMSRMQETIDAQQATLDASSTEIAHLKLQLAKLRRQAYGRKSEKLDRQIEQLELRLEDLVANEGIQDAKPQKSAPERQPAERTPLPSHLPREEHILEPAEQACPQCGGNLKPLGEDIAEQLEIISSAFKVIRTIRKKKACACCDVIVQPPAPSRPILRGIAGPGLLAHILVAKYADHLPLYRQSVSPAFEHQGRHRVAEQVARAGLVDARRLDVIAHQLRHAVGHEGLPKPSEEQRAVRRPRSPLMHASSSTRWWSRMPRTQRPRPTLSR